MSSRGRGSCPKCHEEYFNRSKPPNCPKCGYFLGGTFHGARKKAKSASPALVEVCQGVFSCRTTGRDDRCFVTSRGDMWLCTREECKISRSVHVNSDMASHYECEHIKQAKNTASLPVATYHPSIANYPCSDTVRSKLCEVVSSLPDDSPPVVQVSEQSFAVFGLPTASNPLGFCHVKKETKTKNGYSCTAKDCRNFASKAKGTKAKAYCLHLHILFASLQQFPSTDAESSIDPSAASSSSSSEPSIVVSTPNSEDGLQRKSTILLADKRRSLPYQIPRDLLRAIMARDSCTLFGVEGSWPSLFLPSENHCGLCASPLGPAINHPGQQSNSSYLISELNAFTKVDIKVRTCGNKECMAIHQPFPVDIGLFNICDKVLISLDIMLEFREYFKRGHPLGNVIMSKLSVLRMKCREENSPTDNQLAYIKDLLYNGFFCFEMISKRSLDDVVCGICGICPEVCLGDGNEKNCCSNSQIHYTKKDEPKKDMISLPEFLERVRLRWLERVVYTRIAKPFSVSVEEIPPLIPAVLSGDVVFNSESEKKSVYLESGSKPTGDPALLHKMIVEGSIDMENLQELLLEEVVNACSLCNIPTSGKSKQFLCGQLQGLYASILVGNCPCHSFGKLAGHTGGFYHLVCRHGSTVASKFLSLTESVRDAADLYLSLKHPPVVLINDTPCGFVRHMECRNPVISQELWGSTAGCFETPTLEKDPNGNQNFPCIVPLEYSDGSNMRKQSAPGRSHPLVDTNRHFILGDRFHAATNPHQSHLCRYHDLDLCLQANTLKTSIQESQNNRKNQKRLRSSTIQNFETHVTYNYLMDFYQNEEVVDRQRKIMEQRLSKGQHLSRDKFLRFTIVSDTSS